jgi:long-chain acyl-CoA synthetase
MAGRANADLDIAAGRSGSVDCATSANDRRLDVIGVDICLHVSEKIPYYHTGKVTQVERNLFDGLWKQVLHHRRQQRAVYAEDGSTLRTYQEIEEERDLWRTRLAGFSSGDCVVSAIGNHPGWPGFLLACWDLSLVVAPIEPEMPQQQLARTLQLTQAQGLAQPNGITRIECLPVRWSGSRPDLLKITSGTTGAPRAVRFRQSHLLADCRNICESMEIRPDDINFGLIPFSHSYGFSNLLMPLIFQGTGLVCSTDRMPRAIRRNLECSAATVFPGTPALFQALGYLPESDKLKTVRLCISAGAPLTPEVSLRFYRKFGLKIHSFYGSSECGGIAYDSGEDPDIRPGFVGGVLSGVEIARFDQDRIVVAGPNVADGYFPESDDTLLVDGRFVPGDIVESSNAGFRLLGRISDFVNIAGKKVHPSVIEEHLRKLPGVADAIVFGIPSATRNEELVAYVVASSSVSRQMLETHCRDSLDGWQVPREFHLVAELPFNERGKISRAELSKLHSLHRSKIFRDL